MKLIRFPQLHTEYGIPWTRQHIVRLVKAGKFPKPVKLGSQTKTWSAEEIDDWLAGRAAERDSCGHEADPAPLAARPSRGDE